MISEFQTFRREEFQFFDLRFQTFTREGFNSLISDFGWNPLGPRASRVLGLLIGRFRIFRPHTLENAPRCKPFS